jgi:tRNA pseudouridine38-40 synthase
MRFFIKLSYKGTNYHGWQIQPNVSSIQGELNKALSVVIGEKIEVTGAGRTDAGVHAKQMFAHFDCQQDVDELQLVFQLNSFLPKDITIYSIKLVGDNANCRFDALSRTYNYHIIQEKNSFIENAYLLHKKIDVNAMNLACNYLLGKQDFTSFSKVNTQTATNNCNVMLANWKQIEKQLIFTIKADRFLHNMVRAIVGTLLLVGEGKVKPVDVKEIITKKNRAGAGPSVPAYALFLINIEY